MATVSAKLDRARACADRALECASDFTANQLTVRVRQWAGPRRGGSDNTFHDTDFVLPQKYPMREASQRQVLSSAGRMAMGDVIVENIVPAYTAKGGGGVSEQQLIPQNSFPADDRAREVIYIIEGDISGRYTLVDIDKFDPVYWRLILRKTQDRARLGEVA